MGNFDEAETLLLEALNKVTKIRLAMLLDFTNCTRFFAFSVKWASVKISLW